MTRIIAMTSAALLSLAAGQAFAQTDVGPLKASVSYADLDLSHMNGRAVLERRVSQAVDRVCPERPLPTELRKQRTYRACRESAWSGAQQQLAQIYGGRQLAEASIRVAGTAK